MTDDSLVKLTVEQYLEKLASAAPTPGGGSVAALTAGLAAALGQMVCGFTLGRSKFADVEPEVAQIARRLERAWELLTRLVDEDAAAYATLSAAFKLDKSAPNRQQSIAAAASLAASVPLETAALGARVLSDLRRLSEIGNPQLGSDVEAAQHLARAGIHAAAANVRVNLPLMSPNAAKGMETQLDELLCGTG